MGKIVREGFSATVYIGLGRTEADGIEPPPNQDGSGLGMRMRVRYSGRVQGVGFRATAQSVARRHGALGWVRNQADGSVLMEIQGPEQVVRAALASLASVMERNIRAAEESMIDDVPGDAGFVIRQ